MARSPVLSSLIAALAWAMIAAGTLRPARALPYWKLLVPMTTLQGDLIGALPLMSGFVALQVLTGPLERRPSRRRVIALTVAVSAAAQALEGFASTVVQLMLLSALVGFGPISPLLESLFDDQPLPERDKKARGLIIGLAFTGFLALLDAASPAVMELIGVRWSFWGGALLSALVAPLAWLSLPDAPPRPRVVASDRRGLTPTDRLLMWHALVDGTVYASMTGPLALVLKREQLLPRLWLFGFRRLFPVLTSRGWSRVAIRRRGARSPESQTYRPVAPLAASVLMLAPFAVWLWVALGVHSHLAWWLFGAWAALEIARGFVQTTHRGLPKNDRATFGKIEARTVLGIGIGTYLGLLAFSLWGALAVIVIAVALEAVEIAIAARLAIILATQTTIDSAVIFAPSGQRILDWTGDLVIDCSGRRPRIELPGATQGGPLTGLTLEWFDPHEAAFLRVRFVRAGLLRAALRRRRRTASRPGGAYWVQIGQRHRIRVSGRHVRFHVVVEGDLVRVAPVAAWFADRSERTLAGWRLRPTRASLGRLISGADAGRAAA